MNISFSPGYTLGCYPSDVDGDTALPGNFSIILGRIFIYIQESLEYSGSGISNFNSIKGKIPLFGGKEDANKFITLISFTYVK